MFVAGAALCLTLSGAVLAPAALAASANAPSAGVMSVCSNAKRDARALLGAIGRPTGSDDAGFLYNEMLWVRNNLGGQVRQTATNLARAIAAHC